MTNSWPPSGLPADEPRHVAPSLAATRFAEGRPTVLDGGLGTHLQARGTDVTGMLWSAQVLRDRPDEVRAAHRDFFAAGADVATTCSYQVCADGLLAAGLLASRAEAERECDRLLRLSAAVAREAAEDVGEADGTGDMEDACEADGTHGADVGAREVEDARASGGPGRASGGRIIAASVGPYGAGPGAGTEYDGAYGLTAEELAAWHRPRIATLASTEAGVLLAETIPSILEVRALAGLLAGAGVPWMLSVTTSGGRLRDGTPLADVVRAVAGADGLVALGVNCCAPGEALLAVRRFADAGAGLPLMAYPNSGETWDRAARRWRPAPPGSRQSIAGLVPAFLDAGVRLIGGCCRVGPGQIRQIAAGLRPAGHP